MVGCGLLAGFFLRRRAKTRKRVFLSHSVNLPDSLKPALHTRVRLIIEAYKEPLQLASPEEKRAHQLRRFESWSKTG